MPCSDGRDRYVRNHCHCTERIIEKVRTVDNNPELVRQLASSTKLIKELQNDLNTATRYLCYIVGALKSGPVTELPTEIIKWGYEHHSTDEVRVKQKIHKMRLLGVDSESIIVQLVKEAEIVHPLSEWHKEWFATMVDKIKE